MRSAAIFLALLALLVCGCDKPEPRGVITEPTARDAFMRKCKARNFTEEACQAILDGLKR